MLGFGASPAGLLYNLSVPKQRLDSLLVARELAENKSKARALIMAGEVTVDGKPVTKAGSMIDESATIELAEKLPYVSRGGVKLAHALDEFKLDVAGLTALDVGASTGGFTDCLLQRGASKVYALDVGYGQLDYKLRQDQRVVVLERVNAHYPFDLPEKANLATIDVSFISVTKVIPNVLPHLAPPSYIIILFKPQFEAEKEEVGKGGIIKDPEVHSRVLGRFIVWATEHELRLRNLIASPILGAEGNKEFLILLTPPHDRQQAVGKKQIRMTKVRRQQPLSPLPRWGERTGSKLATTVWPADYRLMTLLTLTKLRAMIRLSRQGVH
ncbi:MAG: TlyA family RNA methyltransferase [Chloroflexi bacterium]|nr:TlyA family RNA methyltransferase [Chloroflexota bacterium]